MAATVLTETGLFRVQRLRYRAYWDAYHSIALENAELLKNGKKPSDAQLAAEKEAAADVQKARDELLAAISRLDQQAV